LNYTVVCYTVKDQSRSRENGMAVRGASETRERILDAAQELFGAHGLEGTSLRAVTAAAGVNLAAVNYHFGSKEELFRAVIRRVMGPVTDEHRRRIEELRGGEPSVEELLDAFVTPFVRLMSGREDRSVARLVGRILTDPDEEIRHRTFEQTGETDAMYLEAFGRALPHLSVEELLWRFYAVLGTIMFQLIGATAMETVAEAPPFKASARNAEETSIRTVAFLAAGLKAPAADPGR